jgi:hypothetical protein
MSHPVMEPYILTATGKKFWFDDPKPEQICIEDIAWALSMLCRYTGHTRYFYSIAQHCYLASFNVPERFALEALLHDAAEAYITDISAPLKGMPEMAGYKVVEARVEKVIAAKFGIGFPLSPTVKQVDMRMLHTEYLQLMPRDNQEWPSFNNAPPLQMQITPFSPEYAREAYMARFIQLTRSQANATS